MVLALLRLVGMTFVLASVSACPLAFRAAPCSSDLDCSTAQTCDRSLQRCVAVANVDGGRPAEPDAEPEPLDAGALDAGALDAGAPDAGSRDAGPRVDGGGGKDAGEPLDAGSPKDDGGRPDGGPLPDAGEACVDADGDGFGPNCPAGPDCAPNNPEAHTFYLGYPDADGDAYTLPDVVQVCTGAEDPEGYRPNASATPDCDDTNAALFRLVPLALDQDLDTITLGPLEDLCIGAAIPTGYRATQSPLDDCDDADDAIGSGPDTDGDLVPDCLDDDDDDDGLSDADEAIGVPPGFPTNPLLADTDSDGVIDRVDAAPTVAACAANVFFSDAFVAAPSAMWDFATPDQFSWNAAQSSLDVPNAFPGAAAWIGAAPTLTDYVVEATLSPNGQFGNAGITFRALEISAINDDGAHYYAGVDPDRNRVVLGFMDGDYTEIAAASVAIEENRPYRLRVELEGDAISVFLDDTLVIAESDSTYTNGSAGVRSYLLPASYANFIVCN